MCHDHDSQPPELPAHRVLPRLAGGAAAEHVETTSADGTRFTVAFAETPSPTGPGVVILPDVRGLAPFYDKLAERFAAAGHHAAVVDYFGRTHPLPRGDDFDAFAATSLTKQDQIQEDTAAAVALLKARTGVDAVVIVGFCFGGTNTYVEHEIHTYPGAPHSFFDRAAEEWAEASADAWERTLDFLQGVGVKTPA